ncbi:thiolase family protein [Leucobacter sp. W1478]|uniref:thiolase family protein n=1 Tax=Leucobacter sp. W1478 TaxID=3439065 RepID=UPI003F3A397B
MNDTARTFPAPAHITGVGLTRFGKDLGMSALELQGAASFAALDDAGITARDLDTVIAGYATTIQHLMPANLLAEYIGAKPNKAFGMSIGGATGIGMVAEAARLVRRGEAETVLVVGGENRSSGQSRDTAISTLAQVGHSTHEVALGANIPAYYALLASEYLDRHGVSREDFAHLAVQMRAHASTHSGAQFTKPSTVADVLAAPAVAEPLGLLDCCPVSDGGAAFVISNRTDGGRGVAIVGTGQANRHQHISEADFRDFGARESSQQALAEAGIGLDDIDVLGIYDSFTVTLAILLEEIGFAASGSAGKMAKAGEFSESGRYPLNLHGGLLSYGHSGVAGGMAHLVEVVTQIRGEAGARQMANRPRLGFLHADGGVLSAHVSLVVDGAPESQLRTTEVSA